MTSLDLFFHFSRGVDGGMAQPHVREGRRKSAVPLNFSLGNMNRHFYRAGIVIGWLFIIYGAFMLVGSLPVLYLLLTGQAQPGEPIFVDDLAPTVRDAIVSTAIAGASVVIGFLVKMYIARRFGKKVPNQAFERDA